ncbi:dual specificity protein phosphatase Mpk3 [Agrilus planipennis]|uniref:protein-tyrosine-phosphatase n=1 Tax=Agrilus planipennis TaxID=224129 RepID=A0A7F5R810_AGRPL|nr:dual specificity protein phosphatase Mpk3 [Agrilus planipennis]
MPTTADCDYECVSKEWLLAELRKDPKNLVILDCRSSNEYGESHIREAVNFSIPSIMLRRLAIGKIDLASTIKCRELKNRICNTYKQNIYVLYNDVLGVQHQQHPNDSTLSVLLRRLTQDGCHVVCLEGKDTKDEGETNERALCTHNEADNSNNWRVNGMKIFLIDFLLTGLEDDKEFPVEILPYLFLGNAANSEDSQALAKHSIQYVLNVTPDLPNVFEDLGHIKYMQIPITDHWSQNLASHFPRAIEFIDEARSRKKGVLVHCLAGISRSVTITVAYLMYKLSLSLEDAFNMVRDRKANIAPNFHFMEQLYNFERQLKLDVSSQSPSDLAYQLRQEQRDRDEKKIDNQNPSRACPNCDGLGNNCKCRQHTEFLSPFANIGVSPDSGIEFDRWASSSTPVPTLPTRDYQVFEYFSSHT